MEKIQNNPPVFPAYILYHKNEEEYLMAVLFTAVTFYNTLVQWYLLLIMA